MNFFNMDKLRNKLVIVLCLSLISVDTQIISENPNDVHFYLYSHSSHPDVKQELILHDSTSLQNSGIQHGQKTVIIIHGFRSSYLSEMPQVVKNAYVSSHFNFNYIVVDWEKLATPLPSYLTTVLYPLAAANVPIVGRRVYEFIAWLKDLNAIQLDQMHLIGHSLGAHVSGLAGRYLATEFEGEKLFRITGLDPAGPLFEPPTPEQNLVKEDAHFVDVIHTNMHSFGDSTKDGHADFYPNGGVKQPGCVDHNGIGDDIQFAVCNHFFSYKLYVASFTKSFHACNCPPDMELTALHLCLTTCPKPAVMGVYCPTSASGQYYIETSNPP